MKFKVVPKSLSDISAGAMVILQDEAFAMPRIESAAIAKHVTAFSAAVLIGECKREWFCTLGKDAGVRTQHLLLESTSFTPWMPGMERMKTTAARAVEQCRAQNINSIAFAVHGTESVESACAMFEGAVLGDFQDVRYKTQAKPRKALELQFVVEAEQAAAVRRALEEMEPILEGVNLARELVNQPHHDLTPAALAGAAAMVAQKHGMKVDILDEKKLKREGYELLYNVGRGSEYPPRMTIVRYVPKGKAKISDHIMLVGKGMTYDTGGLSIKGADSMFKMNQDMGGAAAVIGAMHAIAALKMPVRVTAIIPSAHNAVDGAAFHPGAILRSKKGTTVFIENTDAEGRLILADAFARGAEEKPDVLIDFATLTGAATRALGPRLAALFTEDERLRSIFLAAGEKTGDNLWQLPLWREYEAGLKHHLADMNHVSCDKTAGATNAALFLKHFVPEKARWAHVDIAPVACVEGAKARYFSTGGTGFGVRLTVEALKRMVE